MQEVQRRSLAMTAMVVAASVLSSCSGTDRSVDSSAPSPLGEGVAAGFGVGAPLVGSSTQARMIAITLRNETTTDLVLARTQLGAGRWQVPPQMGTSVGAGTVVGWRAHSRAGGFNDVEGSLALLAGQNGPTVTLSWSLRTDEPANSSCVVAEPFVCTTSLPSPTRSQVSLDVVLTKRL